MNIGLDITPVIYGRGVSLYTANLTRALVQHQGRAGDSELFLYGSSLRQKEALVQFAKHIKQETPRKNQVHASIQAYPPKMEEFLWNTLGVNKVQHLFPKLDVFHSWDWLQPPDKNLPLVSTIHDLAILRFPETAHPKIIQMHRHSWKTLKERNAQIIAVSQATKRDIIELLQIAPNNIHVVYEALPKESVVATEELTEERYEEIKERLGLHRPHILFVGTREPRKNLKRLIEAWLPLAQDIQLIVAGDKGWDETSDEKQFSHPQLRFLGRVTNEELVVLYGEAEIFAYPSLYEGFGLPILEAFYYGTPVLTSNISSMPEVAGNAAELVNPLSVEDIRRGITTLLNESHEEQQRRLQKMLIRLHLFDWQHVAEETMKVYRQAIEQSR